VRKLLLCREIFELIQKPTNLETATNTNIQVEQKDLKMKYCLRDSRKARQLAKTRKNS